MIQLHILCLSLFLIPLLGSITIGPFLSINNAGTAKEFFSILSIFAIMLSGTLWYRVPNKKHHHNFFLYLLILFIPLSIYSAPPLRLVYGFHNLGNLWIWKAAAWILAYFILYKTIIFLPVVKESHKELIGKSIGWSAIISSGYAYIQFLGLDQWQFTRSVYHIGSPTASDITAMIGNPTFLGVWLVICIPFLVIYFKKGWWFFVAGAALLTRSDFALAGIVFLGLFVPCMMARKTIFLKVMVGVAIFAIALTVTFWSEIRPHITDNSRFPMWEQTFKDWKGPCITLAINDKMTKAQKIEVRILNKRTYVFTGRGPGSFPYIFGLKHNVAWESPHNVYLLSLYCIGLIGTVLFLLAIGWIFFKYFWIARLDPYYMALYCSAVFICLAAIGTPLLESQTLRYFSVVIFSLLSSKKV